VTPGDAPVKAPDTDVLEQETKAFNVREIRLSAMAKILAEAPYSLHLQYPDALKPATFPGAEYSGRSLAEILIEMLRPRQYGFYRQGQSLQVVEMQFKQESKPGEGNKGTQQASTMHTILNVKSGEPLDLWIDGSPLLRLRLLAQPLYSENEVGPIGIAIDGHLGREPWFSHRVEAWAGQKARIESRGAEIMWCVVTPLAVQAAGDHKVAEIKLEVEFYHESTLPPA
jgi:hypothetical protein